LFDNIPTNALTRTDGIALLALMVIFMYYIFGMAKSDREKAVEKKINEQEGAQIKQYSGPLSVVLTLVGLVGLVIGGRLLVTGAVDIAQAAGLSEALIGLTIVAIGTSLPELAASLVAALHKQADIAIGNVVGSNIFNVFFVLGTTSVILPLPISRTLNFDILVSIAATALLFIIMFVLGKRRIGRSQGIVFIALYIAYIVFLILRG